MGGRTSEETDMTGVKGWDPGGVNEKRDGPCTKGVYVFTEGESEE